MNERIRIPFMLAAVVAGTLLYGNAVFDSALSGSACADEGGEFEQGEIEREESESPAMGAYFHIMRQYGNPDVDIQDRLWQAALEVNARADGAIGKAADGGSVWTELGPWNIGGRIRGIACSPSEPNTFYAGAASGGVWKSTNAGVAWRPLTDDMPTLGIGAIAVDQTNPNRIFAATGEPAWWENRANASFIVSRSKGVLRSDDAGLTWTMLPWSSAGIYGAYRVALHPQSSDTLLVATMNDLWKSTSGGNNWVRAQTGSISDVIYTPGRPSTVYAAIGNNYGGSRNGVYVSDAGGDPNSWRRLGVNFPAADSCGRILLGISAANPEKIYAAVAMNMNRIVTAGTDFNALLVSTNGGAVWERKYNAISRSFTNGQAWYDFTMAVSPVNPDVLFMGGLEIYRSTNGGKNFTKTSNNVHVDIHSIVFKPGDDKSVVVGCDGGVYVSSNLGSSWTTRNGKLGTIQYYTCNYDPKTPSWVFGGTQDNGTHSLFDNNNSNWGSLYGGDGGSVVIDPSNSQMRYVTSSFSDGHGGVTRPIIRLGGATGFLVLSEGLNEGPSSDRFNWIPPVMFNPKSPSVMYTATQYVYRMKNPTAAAPMWTVISPDVAPNGTVSDFDIPPTNPNWMYTVSSNGRAYICKDLLAIDPTWTAISSLLPGRWLSDIMCDWDDTSTAYVAVSGFGTGHAYKTTNAGASWINISGDLPDIPAGAIIRSRIDPQTIFLATDLGVWYTVNGGANWKRYGDNFPNVVVYDMKLTPDNMLVAGTYGRGMWRAGAILDAEGRPSVMPAEEFALEQNFPNPFNPSTTIPFRIPERERVVLTLHDTQGRMLRTIGDDDYEAGRHTVSFDAAKLPAGVYYTVMTVNGKRQTRKITLLK
jgi:hypothetical protein